MNLQSHLRQTLVTTREFSERLLQAFHTPEEWTFQVHPQSNHALWFAGHIGNTDNFFVSVLAPDQSAPRTGFREKFGPGSQPTNRPEDYPAAEEVLSYLRERRGVLLSLLDSMDDARLETRTPKGSPEFIPDFASVFRAAGWHEGVHAGQLTVVRRALGHPPLMNGPPPG